MRVRLFTVVDTLNGDFDILLPFSNTEISKPAFSGGYIFFTGGFNGTDNIFAIHQDTKILYKFTASRFGATDADISPDGTLLLYSNYTSSGYELASMALSPDNWTKCEPGYDHRWELADQLAAQENFIFNSKEVPDSSYAIKPYRKCAHLFHFHSWAPLSVDVDNIENIAQTVNVLQAMVLTHGERMLLTPSYHVFEMYKVHQDTLMLPVEVECEHYEHKQEAIPSLSASASRSDDGRVHLTLCNAHPTNDTTVAVELRGLSPRIMRGRILTNDRPNAHNSFDNTEQVKPVELPATNFDSGVVRLELPSKSVTAFEIS